MLFDEMEKEKIKENKISNLTMLKDEIGLKKTKEKKKSNLLMLLEEVENDNQKKNLI